MPLHRASSRRVGASALALILAGLTIGCDRTPEPPPFGAEVFETIEVGASRPDVLVALPVGPRIGETGRLVVGYPRDRYIIDGRNIEVLWFRARREVPLAELTREEVTPIVFVNEYLDGWGWSAFEARAAEWELRNPLVPREREAPAFPTEEPPDTSPSDGEGDGGGTTSDASATEG